jgi:LacI family transcriptional regulator
MRKWTIKDIAAEAGVSKTTVSRVLNGQPDVDVETLNRVHEIIDRVGYVRSAKALRLAHGRANIIALVAAFDTSTWMVEVLRGTMGVLRSTQFSLTLHALPETEEDAARILAQLKNGSMDAVLVVSLRQSVPIFAEAAQNGLPIMFLNNYGFNEGLPDVMPDEAVGITEAVDHLVDIGRRRFAMIAGTADYPDSDRRFNAYGAALARHGIALDPQLIVHAPFTEISARQATQQLLDRNLPFDALFASSDAMAIGAIRTLKRNNLNVPNDISVVGFDDFPGADYCDPPLTTVHNPLFEMSARATSRLLAAVVGNATLSAAGEEIVRTHLVIRDSSRPSKG